MAQYASKSPRDLNHDPMPWDYIGDGYAARFAHNSPGHVYARDAVYDPRPEFDHAQHNEPNPILVGFREEVSQWHFVGLSDLAQNWVDWADSVGMSYDGDAEVEHARKVLTRLSRLEQK